MQIITLITDLGQEDHYVGILKGALLSHHSELNLVDISHNVKNFDIVHAAFILKNTYTEFPQGTIHIVNVMSFHDKKSPFVAVQQNGHYFLGPDNGVLPLAFDGELKDVFSLGEVERGVMGMKDVLGKAVSHLTEGKPIEEIGEKIENIEKRISLQPVVSNGQLRGSVIHVDHFGNVILNIDEKLFKEVCGNRNFSLFFKRNEPITEMSQYYSDVPVGDLLCLFNSANHLEIAMNMDSAAEKYGLKMDDAVIIRLD